MTDPTDAQVGGRMEECPVKYGSVECFRSAGHGGSHSGIPDNRPEPHGQAKPAAAHDHRQRCRGVVRPHRRTLCRLRPRRVLHDPRLSPIRP